MRKKKVLVADDEKRMRRLVSDFLKKDGYEVVEAADGEEAIELFFQEPQSFDVVILDIMMPKMEGWEVCKEIRGKSDVPIVMLTARGEERDELLGLAIGADEYITKPFSVVVLMARIDALLRRVGMNKCQKKNVGSLEVDIPSRNVVVDETQIDLTHKEFELLSYFLSNEGIALTREQIINNVWSYDYFGDIRTVDTHVKKLRAKLKSAGELIQTVRSTGYKFEVIE